MDKKSYLIDLIDRMLNRTMEYVDELDASIYTISNRSYEEASHLSDESYIEPLKEIVNDYSTNKVKDKDRRGMAYHILEKIALNTDNKGIIDFFTERLYQEIDKNIIGILLVYIARQSYLPTSKKILPFIHDKRWQIQFEALKVVSRYPKEEVEDDLISVLQEASDPFAIDYIIGALNEVKSEKALPLIRTFLGHRSGEVRSAAIAALSKIGGEEYLSVFIDMFPDRSPIVKSNALAATIQHGDESVIDILINRIKTVVKTKRKTEVEPKTEVIQILEFLQKYIDDARVKSLFLYLRDKRWDNLFTSEKNWLGSDPGV